MFLLSRHDFTNETMKFDVPILKGADKEANLFKSQKKGNNYQLPTIFRPHTQDIGK